MADLAKLIVRLEAQTAQYDKKLEEATRKLRSFSNQTSGILSVIERNFGKFAAGISVAGLAAFVKHSIDAADAAGKVSQQLGISTESFTRLAYGAKLANIEQEELQLGLKKFATTVYDASRGSDQAVRSLAAFGLTAAQLKGLALDQQFALFADRVAGFADSGDKAAGVEDVLGKNMAKLIPLLNDGAAGLKAAGDESDRLGNTISGKTAAAAAEFNETMTRLQAAARGAGLKLAEALLPHLERFAKQVQDPEFQKKLADVVANVAKLADIAASGASKVALFGAAVAHLAGLQDGSLLGLMEEREKKAKELALFDRLAALESNQYYEQRRNDLINDIALLNRKIKVAEKAAAAEQGPQARGAPEVDGKTGGGKTFVGVNEEVEKNRKAVEEYIGSLRKKLAGEEQATKVSDLYAQSLKGSAEAQYEVYRAEELASEQFKKADADQRKAVLTILDSGAAFAQQKDQIDLARDVYEKTRTPLEKLNVELEKLAALTAKDKSGKPLLDEDTRAREAALLRLSGVQEQYSKIIEAEALEEERIRNSQEAGARSEFDAMTELGKVRKDAIGQLDEMVDSYARLADASKQPALIANAERMRVELEKLKGEADVVGNQFRGELKDDLATAFEGLITNVHNAGDVFRNFFDSILAYLNKLAAQQLAQAIVGGGSGGGGLLDKLFNAFSGYFSSSGGVSDTDLGSVSNYASGGFVAANQPSWVGEHGPEMFIPSGAGRIVPTGKAMGGDTHVSFNVYGVSDADSFRRSRDQILSQVGTAVSRARLRNG